MAPDEGLKIEKFSSLEPLLPTTSHNYPPQATTSVNVFGMNDLFYKTRTRGASFQKQPPRQFSKLSVLFFQEQPFYNFLGGFICSSNRHEFFQKGLYVLRTDTNFPGGLIEKICFFKEVLSVRRTDLIISSNQILISPETFI